MEPGDVIGKISLDALHFSNALKFVESAISNEETRYYLNGVFLNMQDKELVACDGHRLNKIALNIDINGIDSAVLSQHGAGRGVIIPKKAVALILAEKRFGELEIVFYNTAIEFNFANGLKILTKLIDGKFPEYPRVIPAASDSDKTLVIKAAAFKADYKKARAIKTQRLISLSAAGFNYSAGKFLASEAASGWQDGQGFNAAYIADAIDAMGGDLELVSGVGHKPAVMRGKDRLVVIMPMRV
jgi:DNA polymerase-3 subunit beta